MLVLSRKLGEAILIGDDVVIRVVEISRGKIRLGLLAPAATNIVREELLAPDDARHGLLDQTK